MFKNFDDISVWKVIEECGLRGASVGDAKVSEKHCNMIVNNGNATSSDVKKLIEKIIVTVREKTKREMVLEQRIIKWDD